MDIIDRIRRFNRSHTRRLGLLRQGYLDAGLSFAEARTLYELQDRTGWNARALASHLGLNEGYFSRLIARLQSKGFVTRQPDKDDRRVMTIELSDLGKAAAQDLVIQAREQIEGWLAPLSAAQALLVAEQMGSIETLLDGGPNPQVDLRDLDIGDAGWLIQQHAEYYAQNDGFDRSFEALVAEILADFIRNRDPLRERAWIAWQGQSRLGSIFCVTSDDPDWAKLRLFYLTPESRGLGLGQRLLATCMEYARTKGYRGIVLWTHASHEEACRLYEKTGFQLLDSFPVTSFGQALEEQHWKLEFD